MNPSIFKMRLLSVLVFALPVFSVSGEEDFRQWRYFNDADMGEGKLLEYNTAYPLEDLTKEIQLTEDRIKWLQEQGQSGDFVRVVKLTLKVPPKPKEPDAKPDPKAEPELVDVTYPFAYFSSADQEYVMDWDWLRQREPFFKKCLHIVLGEERGIRKSRPEPEPKFDVIYLRDGSKKRGIVQNTSFSLHAKYGRFAVSRDKLSAVQFGDGKGGHDLLVGVNNNRLSGIIDLPADSGVGVTANHLVTTNESGQSETIRKEKLSRIIFRVRPDELTDLNLDGSALVRLKNGDAFDARVSGGEFKIGTRRIATDQVSSVEVIEGRANLIMKSGGKEIGDFSEADLPMELALGPSINVYRAYVVQIYCDSNFRPVGKILSASEPRVLTLSFERDKPGVLRSVSRSSVYYEVLEKGDRIISIDGRIPDFDSKDTTYELILESLFEDKTATHFVLDVERDGLTFSVTVRATNG